MGKKSDTIRIFLRIRPAPHPSNNYRVERDFDSARLHIHLDREKHGDVVNNEIEDYRFSFNGIFDQDATQQHVFDLVAKDCVASTLEGFNSTIFAYGQTGSGKTFSITGGSDSYDQRGIIPRALGMIWDEVAQRPDLEWTIRVSYLQIYQNQGQDLLNRGQDARCLEDLPKVTVQENDDEFVAKDLGQHRCDKIEDALNLLFLGDTNRMYCETPMNQTSSRSHCIFTVAVERKAPGSAVVRRSKLHLVDLAGSERPKKTGVDGQLLREAASINLTLMYLEQVIKALSEQAEGRRDHIPYRNSLMTMILRDSLGGNCKTTMLATAHPQDAWMDETISTCKFAQRVAQVKLSAHINEELDPALLVKKLRAEVAALKEELAMFRKGDQAGDRVLSAEEQSRCREIVQRYLDDPDPEARLTGLDGDLARIFCCFSVMKEVCKGRKVPAGRGPAAAAGSGAAAAKPTPPSPASAGGSGVSQGGGDSGAAVHALQMQLQQRDQELSLLLGIVQKYQTPKVAVQTQTGEAGGVAVEAPPAGPYTHTSPPAPPAARRGSADGPTAPGAMGARPRDEQLRMAATEHQLAGDYNLEALQARGTELFRDTALAFEEFRKSWRKYEQIERQKDEQRRRCERAKSLAATINEHSAGINALKGRIQQLRAERATHGWEEPDEEERSLFAQLDSRKAQYRALVASLAEEKRQFEHFQAIIQQISDKLSRDFESWWALRRWQMGAGAPPAAAAAPSSAWPARQTPAAAAIPQQLHIMAPPPAACGAAGGAAPRPQSAQLREQQQRAQPQVRERHHNAAATAPPAARGPLVGPPADAEVQKELRRLFQARDKMLGRSAEE